MPHASGADRRAAATGSRTELALPPVAARNGLACRTSGCRALLPCWANAITLDSWSTGLPTGTDGVEWRIPTCPDVQFAALDSNQVMPDLVAGLLGIPTNAADAFSGDPPIVLHEGVGGVN